MKKLASVLAVFVLVFSAPHFSFAADNLREEVKKLAVMNAELLVELVQAKVENLDLKLEFLNYVLTVTTELRKFGDNNPELMGNVDDAKETRVYVQGAQDIIKARIRETSRYREQTLELLVQAKRALEEAKSLE